ncbi:hypothetical protein [Yersinia mollaretii]|uniref:hypothetical protein n=2 Tax=Yersinia mollaretii TaxID=33060 RepID=UPI0005DDCF11|nr:hypothetical protein [Yersinia mollaretii]PJE86257.1 hypothetical protein CU280_18860 [Yersinia mollaretii]CQH07443.1 Uncharacterised protein [Yersinia mollaretii]
MMAFSEGQLELLKTLSFKGYVSEVVSHCELMYPALVSLQGQERFSLHIEKAIALAKKTGFTQRGPVRFYIDMMILLGSNFEHDPQHQWAEFNKINSASSQLEKSISMYNILEQYIGAIYGESNCFFEQSLVRLRNLDVSHISDNKKNYRDNTHELLNYIHPQRYNLLGNGAVDALIYFSDENTPTNVTIKPNHKSYTVLIRFLLGSHFNSDFFRYDSLSSKLINYVSEENIQYHDVISSTYSCLRFNNN